MRPLLLFVTLFAAAGAAAEVPRASAAPQADDTEVPPTGASPPPPPVPSPRREPASPPVLFVPSAPAGFRYQLVESAPRQERRWGLFTAGIVTFGGVWMVNLQAGILSGQTFLAVPLIGPLMETSIFTRESDGTAKFWLDFTLVADAAAQIGGLALMIAGAGTRRHLPGRTQIQLVPLGAGAAVRGAF